MSCGKQTFNSITREQYDCLLTRIAAAGFPLSGDSGQISQDGFVINWSYDSESGLLEIECMSSPFFVPCSSINGKIHDLINECTT